MATGPGRENAGSLRTGRPRGVPSPRSRASASCLPPRAFRPCSRARIPGLAPRSVGVAPLLRAGGAPRPVTSPPSRSLPGCSRREMSWRPRPPRPCPPGRSRCSQPPPLGQVRGVPYGAGLAGGVPERTPQLRGSAARADPSSPSLSGGAGRAARPPRAGRGWAGPGRAAPAGSEEIRRASPGESDLPLPPLPVQPGGYHHPSRQGAAAHTQNPSILRGPRGRIV